MFYISRFVGAKKFGLCNTDDGVEQIVDGRQLESIVIGQGVEVKGVTVAPWNSSKRISLVDVYQVEFTTKQAKCKVMLGVDIKLFRGTITSIEWDKSPNGMRRRIRLSDFGVACGAKLFHTMAVKYFRGAVRHSDLVLILDDKLQCDQKAFKYALNTDVMFDLREVTDVKIANTFYLNYLNTNMADEQLNEFVLDIPERLDYWYGVKVVNYGLTFDPLGNHISHYVNDTETVIEAMYQKYKSEFLALPKKFSFKLREDDSNHSIRTSVANQVNFFLHNRPDIITSQDFELLWKAYNINHDIPSIRLILEYDTEQGLTAPLRRLRNYLEYIDRPDDFKQVFIDLYHKILDQLICIARDNRWVEV